MADVLVKESSLQSIADAIRAKIGSTDTYKPSEMATAIQTISSDGGLTVLNAVNLHNSATDIADIYLERGVETAYNGWGATDYIPIRAGTCYAIQVDETVKGMYCAVYDTAKNYIRLFAGGFCSAGQSCINLFVGEDGYIRFSGASRSIANLAMYACSGSYKFGSTA